MDISEALDKLRQIDQRHLLLHLEKLNLAQKAALLRQIEQLDTTLFRNQQQLLTSIPATPVDFTPFTDYYHAGSSTDAQIGREILSRGGMGCLIIAGGQGSRLRLENSKGLTPVSVIEHKSLFQLFAEKTLAASKQAQRPLFLAIMTSPLNHDQTISFFQKNHFFGLEKEQLFFFSQQLLPLLDDGGNLFLDTPWHIAEGPNGNGDALRLFYQSGIWKQWHELGVTHLNFVQVDNPLADPFDAELLGFHFRQNNEITIKCTPRRDSSEKVGVLVQRQEHCQVVEYSEFPQEEWIAQTSEKSFKNLCANLSLFCFDMALVEKLFLAKKFVMPLHLARKAVKMLSPDGEIVLSEQPNAWKFERFIFDILPFSDKIKALLYPRERCYAPLKNLTGEDSLQSVRQALQSMDYQVYYHISGKLPPTRPFELSQEFYYPTPRLLQKWKGRELPPNSYIEA